MSTRVQLTPENIRDVQLTPENIRDVAEFAVEHASGNDVVYVRRHDGMWIRRGGVLETTFDDYGWDWSKCYVTLWKPGKWPKSPGNPPLTARQLELELEEVNAKFAAMQKKVEELQQTLAVRDKELRDATARASRFKVEADSRRFALEYANERALNDKKLMDALRTLREYLSGE